MPNKLHTLQRAVALEAFSMHDISAYFKEMMPTLASSFQDFADRFSPKEHTIQFTSGQRDFEKNLSVQNYVSTAQITAFIPEGLNVSYLDYADVLRKAVDHASRVMDVLAPYSVYLAQLLSNKEAGLSTKSFESEFKLLAQERAALNAALGECFKKGSTRSEASMGEVVQRNGDWKDVFATTQAIAEKINKIDRGALLKKVHECSGYLDRILKMAKSGEIEKIANQTVMNLADGAYQVASELEFYAVAYYKAETFVNAINQTVEHFNTVHKK